MAVSFRSDLAFVAMSRPRDYRRFTVPRRLALVPSPIGDPGGSGSLLDEAAASSVPSNGVSVRRRLPMRARDNFSHRRFYCARCREAVVICRRCDRGQRYCGSACSAEARRESLRRAGKRYQASPAGREANAERQRRFRRRRVSGVTHRGYQNPSDRPQSPRTASLVSRWNEHQPSRDATSDGRTPSTRVTSAEEPLCSRCSCPCSHFSRFGFLERRLSARSWAAMKARIPRVATRRRRWC